jgi:hypothetical protein
MGYIGQEEEIFIFEPVDEPGEIPAEPSPAAVPERELTPA